MTRRRRLLVAGVWALAGLTATAVATGALPVTGGGGSSSTSLVPAAPIAPGQQPGGYVIPAGTTLINSIGQITTALANGGNYTIANGSYTNVGPLAITAGKAVNFYAQTVGGVTFNFGIGCGMNFGGPSSFNGIIFSVSSTANCSQQNGTNDIIAAWGAGGAGLGILDCTLNGNGVCSNGINHLAPQGVVLQRCVITSFLNDGARLSDNDGPFATGNRISIVSDLTITSCQNGGASGGTGEAGLWIGQPVDAGVQRIAGSLCWTTVLWTGNSCYNTAFTDLNLVGMGGGATNHAIYTEHFTVNCTFYRYNLSGFWVSEYDQATPGNAAGRGNALLGGVITAANGASQCLYLDAGTDGWFIDYTTFQNYTTCGIRAVCAVNQPAMRPHVYGPNNVYIPAASSPTAVPILTTNTATGALPTFAFVSGTGRQAPCGAIDTVAMIPYTTTAAAGTLVVALSPDNTTYSNIATITPAITAFTGILSVYIPAGWYVKLTATNMTIGAATYYYPLIPSVPSIPF